MLTSLSRRHDKTQAERWRARREQGRAPASEQSIEWSWGWGGECGEFPVMGEAGAPAASPDQRLGGAGWGNAFLPEAATAHALRQL